MYKQKENVTNYSRFEHAKKKNYLNQQNPLFLPIIAYTLSTTQLEIRAK
jgi:hypothetical protein